jgi:hypothetical protein
VTRARYPDPEALRRAVTDRLRTLAGDEPGAQLGDLLRQLAYDRLLYRVFTASDSERWVLKGATALLARLGPAARHTVDVDLFDQAGDLDAAEAALRVAVTTDVGDFFRFTLSPGRSVADRGVGRRVPVTAFLGATRFAEFHVDLVTDLRMTGILDDVGPLPPIELPGLPRVTYRAYPLEDHIADKVCALLELHPRASGPAQPSTRYRDLADLAAVARQATVDASRLAGALRSEAARRGLDLPDRISVPTEAGWTAGYARVAREIRWLPDRTVDAALETVGRFIDPLLGGGLAGGSWNHGTLAWE